jgi:NAD-dependent SIR2 family protein deacetylase
MSTVLYCNDCNWSGYPEELVALSDDLNDRDFSHCPWCEGQDFEEVEEE